MQESFVGEGAIERLGILIEKYSPKTILLVRGSKSYQVSRAENVIKKFIPSSTTIIDFFDFAVNPQESDLQKAIENFHVEKIDLIIAIGGGSVLDMAKLIRFFLSFEGNIEKNEYQQTCSVIPLIAIPTTAGTGSEATHFAVLYKNKIKYSVAHSNILPDYAIVDPVFTWNIPPYITACTGFDALAQAIEAYWNVNAKEESDLYAEQAIQLIYKNLPLIIKKGNRDAANKVSEGSHLAGKAINITKTTAPHAFSYPFTTYYGFPHGHAVALTFPFFMQFNYTENQVDLVENLQVEKHIRKMKNIYNWIGAVEANQASVIIAQLIREIGLSFDLPENFNAEIILENINHERMGNNPRLLSLQEAKDAVNSISQYK
jgi:alcohol dehydrogenase class IV